MQLAVIAAIALTAVSAEVSTTRCNTTTVTPWISTSADPGKACLESNGFRGSGYASPTEVSALLVCGYAECRTMLEATVAVRPAIGDCFVSQSGVKINFYETVILPYVEACKSVPVSTLAPSPSNGADTIKPVPSTLAPSPSDGAGTIKPAPSTLAPSPSPTRPQC